MKEYKIIIEVNEKKLRTEAENKTDKIEWLIENEFGWLSSSGITLIKIIKEGGE